MLTTTDWISYLKSCTSIQSDYGIAKLLRINRSTMSNMSLRKSFISAKSADRMAKELKIEPYFIYICAQFERAQCEEERKLWLDLYEHVGGPQMDEKIRKYLENRVMKE